MIKNSDVIQPFPSRANYIFFSCAFDSDRIYTQRVEKGIIVKNLNSTLMPECMRVTVENRKESNAFLNVWKSVVS